MNYTTEGQIPPQRLRIDTCPRTGKTGWLYLAAVPFILWTAPSAALFFSRGETSDGTIMTALSAGMIWIIVRARWPYYRNEYWLNGTTLSQRVGRKRYIVCDLRTADISADSIPTASGSAAIPRIIVTTPGQDALILPLRSNPDNELLPARALLAIADAITIDRSEQHLQEIGTRLRQMAKDPFGLTT